jgi:tRNA A58 N-methylase Trm61
MLDFSHIPYMDTEAYLKWLLDRWEEIALSNLTDASDTVKTDLAKYVTDVATRLTNDDSPANVAAVVADLQADAQTLESADASLGLSADTGTSSPASPAGS